MSQEQNVGYAKDRISQGGNGILRRWIEKKGVGSPFGNRARSRLRRTENLPGGRP